VISHKRGEDRAGCVDTLADPGDADGELQHLLAALGTG
jgi:hypothetical protein